MPMLEGREVEGQIGKVGTYFADVKPDATVEAGADVKYEQEFSKWFKVKASGSLGVDMDAFEGLKALVGKNEFLLKAIDGIRLMIGRK